jgi:hypothetical protein
MVTRNAPQCDVIRKLFLFLVRSPTAIRHCKLPSVTTGKTFKHRTQPLNHKRRSTSTFSRYKKQFLPRQWATPGLPSTHSLSFLSEAPLAINNTRNGRQSTTMIVAYLEHTKTGLSACYCMCVCACVCMQFSTISVNNLMPNSKGK